jgi:hypothetical protein
MYLNWEQEISEPILHFVSNATEFLKHPTKIPCVLNFTVEASSLDGRICDNCFIKVTDGNSPTANVQQILLLLSWWIQPYN